MPFIPFFFHFGYAGIFRCGRVHDIDRLILAVEIEISAFVFHSVRYAGIDDILQHVYIAQRFFHKRKRQFVQFGIVAELDQHVYAVLIRFVSAEIARHRQLRERIERGGIQIHRRAARIIQRYEIITALHRIRKILQADVFERFPYAIGGRNVVGLINHIERLPVIICAAYHGQMKQRFFRVALAFIHGGEFHGAELRHEIFEFCLSRLARHPERERMSVRFSADRNFRVQRHHGVFFQRIGKFSVGGNAGFVGTRPFDRRVFRGDIFRQKQIVHDRVAAHGIGNIFQFVCEQ